MLYRAFRLLLAAASLRGRASRRTWWRGVGLTGLAFALVLPAARYAPGNVGVVLLDVPVFASLVVLGVRRLHDRGRRGAWLLAGAVPVLGPLWLLFELGFRRGQSGSNLHGPDPLELAPNYARVNPLPVAGESTPVVEDVTRLYRVPVFAIAAPRTIAEVVEALVRSKGPVSIGGGRFSMGGQVASPGSLHLDMRAMNRVLAIDVANKTARVEPGVRWCDLQAAIDPHGLAVSIMQTYANFTVGGSVGVNVHGRYVGLGPLVLAIRSVHVVLADGTLVHASRDANRDVFAGVVGGYGALGVVVEVELDLADNVRVEEQAVKLPTRAYVEHFRTAVRDDASAVFHNADLYLPHMSTCRVATWRRTQKAVTAPGLQRPQPAYPLQVYLAWAMSETPFAGWRREHLIEPLRFAVRRVHTRNHEAGYDVAELEPPSRKNTTFVLQEYFVPVDKFDAFVPRMAEIFTRHGVNVINVSIRHAMPDTVTLLSWAPVEVYAFVVYYKQRTRPNARERVAVWTRELMDAALACGGRWYLPYQAHATEAQFHAAYPGAAALFALKGTLDPDFRFRNVLWDTYYRPTLTPTAPSPLPESEFHAVYDDTRSRDAFYLFLQNVFHLVDEDRFHQLIIDATARHADDEAIYREVQRGLPGIRTALAPVTHALPALRVQKAEMARQVAQVLGGRSVRGYVEIGTVGRYVNPLRGVVAMEGPTWIVNDVAPGNGPVDIVERGQLGAAGVFVPLGDYDPLPEPAIPTASVDLVTCFIGLHHVNPDRLDAFIGSIHRVLRPGGVFLLRDHDVQHARFDRFVALAHTVFNCGLDAPWAVNAAERRHFAPLASWVQRLEAGGLRDLGARVLQPNDPTANTLVAFERLA